MRTDDERARVDVADPADLEERDVLLPAEALRSCVCVEATQVRARICARERLVKDAPLLAWSSLLPALLGMSASSASAFAGVGA